MYSKICDVNEHLDGLPLSEALLSVIQARDQILQSAQPEKTADISRRLYWFPSFSFGEETSDVGCFLRLQRAYYTIRARSCVPTHDNYV